MSRLKAIFPDDWQCILDVYKGFLCSIGPETATEELLLALLEVGVRFGERLSKVKPNGFIEIGCGLAIPSLTLAKLGNREVKAVDIDSIVLSLCEHLTKKLGCFLEFQCRDIFDDRPKLQKGALLIEIGRASCREGV